MRKLTSEMLIASTVAFLFSIALSVFASKRTQGRWLILAVVLFAVNYLLFLGSANR